MRCAYCKRTATEVVFDETYSVGTPVCSYHTHGSKSINLAGIVAVTFFVIGLITLAAIFLK